MDKIVSTESVYYATHKNIGKTICKSANQYNSSNYRTSNSYNISHIDNDKRCYKSPTIICTESSSNAYEIQTNGTTKLRTTEKIVFGVGDFGANYSWTFIASFIIIYMTDVVGCYKSPTIICPKIPYTKYNFFSSS